MDEWLALSPEPGVYFVRGADGFVWQRPDQVSWRSLDGARVEALYSVR